MEKNADLPMLKGDREAIIMRKFNSVTLFPSIYPAEVNLLAEERRHTWQTVCRGFASASAAAAMPRRGIAHYSLQRRQTVLFSAITTFTQPHP